MLLIGQLSSLARQNVSMHRFVHGPKSRPAESCARSTLFYHYLQPFFIYETAAIATISAVSSHTRAARAQDIAAARSIAELKHSSRSHQNSNRSAPTSHLPPRSNKSDQSRTEYDVSICSGKWSAHETCGVVDFSCRAGLESGTATVTTSTVTTSAAGLLLTSSIGDTAIWYVADEGS